MTIVFSMVLAASVGFGPNERLLYGGKMNPACVWTVEVGTNGVMKPIEIVTDFGETREIAGVRFWAGPKAEAVG